MVAPLTDSTEPKRTPRMTPYAPETAARAGELSDVLRWVGLATRTS